MKIEKAKTAGLQEKIIFYEQRLNIQPISNFELQQKQVRIELGKQRLLQQL